MIFLILAIPVTTVTLFVVQNNVPQTKTVTKCPNNCSGNGTCDPLTGKCTCNAGYFGNDCSNQIPTDCNGHGTYDPTTKTCKCTAPYSGPACSVNCSTVICNKEGICNPEDGTCKCTGNFTGPNCDQCNGNFALPDCTKCKDGYYGDACQTPCDAAKTCNGNGTCDTNGSCKCNPNGHFASNNATCLGTKAGSFKGGGGNCADGWEGLKCDQKVCPWDKNKECSGNGTCDADGTCSCNFGYAGESCSTDLTFLIIIGIIFGVGLVAYFIWWFFYTPPRPGYTDLKRTIAKIDALERAEKNALEELKDKSLSKQQQKEFIKEKKEQAIETPEQTARRKLLKDISDNTQVPGYKGRKAQTYPEYSSEPSEELKRQFQEDEKILVKQFKDDKDELVGKQYVSRLLKSIPGEQAYGKVHQLAESVKNIDKTSEKRKDYYNLFGS
jgi:hypothetical protein